MTKDREAEREAVAAFVAEKVPEGWATGSLDVALDQDEILVVIPIDDDPSAFRERTRDRRMKIADQAQRRFGRTVSWGVAVNDERHIFTALSLPVMTRLRLPERAVLDTLVAAGVARSRSDALGWCVRLVGRHESTWLADLEEAIAHVRQVRAEGPVAL